MNKHREYKKTLSLYRYGVRYCEEQKCPACSSENDKGGRLKVVRRKNVFLKCDLCRYAIQSDRVVAQKERFIKRYLDKQKDI